MSQRDYVAEAQIIGNNPDFWMQTQTVHEERQTNMAVVLVLSLSVFAIVTLSLCCYMYILRNRRSEPEFGQQTATI